MMRRYLTLVALMLTLAACQGGSTRAVEPDGGIGGTGARDDATCVEGVTCLP
ncbi:hypothetical protein [Jannaschia sp. LMIT008]|uniref:hypothetical protein n=1 Tax=Jannaschia maritima TaxID=3032585 RepID=UPI002811A6E5|nr:hypothetical protein [Jannaschia sp. LMIT008]